MLATLLGATMFADAFNVAFRIPNLLRDLFAEGALSQAFVPTFKTSLKHEGPERAYQLANRVAGTLVAVTGFLVLVAAIFAPTVVRAVSHANFTSDPERFELTIQMTRIMLPFLPTLALAAVAMGMLNAQDRYAAPALAPAMFNVASIGMGLVLYASGAGGRNAAIGWSVGTLIGGLAQLGIQLPSLFRIGYRPRLAADLRLRDPRVRRVGRLMLPAVIGVAAVQVNLLVNTIFATSEVGAASWLNYAFRFLYLPIGVFGVAIATVSTTRYADAATDGDRGGMARQLEASLRLTAFLTVPSTLGLIVLAEPIIALVYQHGRFSPAATHATAVALQLYAVGLVAYSAVKVVAPAFYAVDQARIPMIASISAVGGNVILNVALHPVFGYRVLALGTALAATLNFAVLYTMFSRRIARIGHAGMAVYLARVVVAAGMMAAAVYGARVGLAALVPGASIPARALVALVPVVVGGLVYAVACWAMRIEEIGTYLRRLRRRAR
jgi:putative peptidoglycan lipid II flippase